MEETVMAIIKEYGFNAGLVAFFMWWTWKRESRLTARLDKVQDDFTETLRTTIAACTEAMKASVATSKELTSALTSRPCMKPECKK